MFSIHIGKEEMEDEVDGYIEGGDDDLTSLELLNESCCLCVEPSNGEPLCARCHKMICRKELDCGRDEALLKKPEPEPMEVEQVGGKKAISIYSERKAKELFGRIEPKIWTAVFKNLDDVSLIMASRVCQKWKDIILECVPSWKWKTFVEQRWPLFKSIEPVEDWFDLYSNLVESLPCKRCFMNITQNSLPSSIDDRVRTRRLNNEIKLMRSIELDGIRVVPLDKLKYNWMASIVGPIGTVFEGGVFYLNFKIPKDYPFDPPVIRFLTKVLHPDVLKHGEVINIWNEWKPILKIPDILLRIQKRMNNERLSESDWNIHPDLKEFILDVCDAEDPKKLILEIADHYTRKYAMHDI